MKLTEHPQGTPDIVPYTREDAKAMAELLFAAGIPSMGPTIAMKMIELSMAINAMIDKRPDLADGVAWPVSGYAMRIRDVAIVQGELVGLVVDKLSGLIETEKKKGPE